MTRKPTDLEISDKITKLSDSIKSARIMRVKIQATWLVDSLWRKKARILDDAIRIDTAKMNALRWAIGKKGNE